MGASICGAPREETNDGEKVYLDERGLPPEQAARPAGAPPTAPPTAEEEEQNAGSWWDYFTKNSLPIPTEPADHDRLLVIGSSVSTGEGAKNKYGWSAHLAAAMEQKAVEVVNRGAGGTSVKYWNSRLDGEDVSQFQTVVMSLSCGNEGLARASGDAIETIEQHYINGLLTITQKLRQQLKPTARLVLGGPYPNGGYTTEHLAVVQRVLETMKTWKEVDYVIDFMQPVVNDGSGHWHEGAWRDNGHPNSVGHHQMFQCIDLDMVKPYSSGCGFETEKTKTTPASLAKPCASGCGFAVTWHKTHCCAACAKNGTHGPRCQKISLDMVIASPAAATDDAIQAGGTE